MYLKIASGRSAGGFEQLEGAVAEQALSSGTHVRATDDELIAAGLMPAPETAAPKKGKAKSGDDSSQDSQSEGGDDASKS